MMFIILLALAHATLGSPIDTPEVASAKQAHLLADALARSRAEAAPQPIASIPAQLQAAAQPSLNAARVFLADAPEIAAAKAAHLAEQARLGDHSWESHINNPQLAARADTPEAHLAAQAQASRLAAAISQARLIPESPELALARAAVIAQQANPWAAVAPASLPIQQSALDSLANSARLAEHARAAAVANAIVDQTPLGYIQDTPEVAAAKASHLAAKWAAISAAQ